MLRVHVDRVIAFGRNHNDNDQVRFSLSLRHDRIRHLRFVEILIFHEDKASCAADQPEITLPDIVPLYIRRIRPNRDCTEHLQFVYVLADVSIDTGDGSLRQCFKSLPIGKLASRGLVFFAIPAKYKLSLQIPRDESLQLRVDIVPDEVGAPTGGSSIKRDIESTTVRDERLTLFDDHEFLMVGYRQVCRMRTEDVLQISAFGNVKTSNNVVERTQVRLKTAGNRREVGDYYANLDALFRLP